MNMLTCPPGGLSGGTGCSVAGSDGLSCSLFTSSDSSITLCIGGGGGGGGGGGEGGGGGGGEGGGGGGRRRKGDDLTRW